MRLKICAAGDVHYAFPNLKQMRKCEREKKKGPLCCRGPFCDTASGPYNTGAFTTLIVFLTDDLRPFESIATSFMVISPLTL